MTVGDQFHHLLEMARRPNINIRIVPFSSGWHPGLESAFGLIQPADSMPVVYVELRISGLFLHEEADVEAYSAAIDLISQASLGPEASLRLVAETVERMERTE